MSLENLKMLHHLNLSFNKLSGEAPKGGLFKKLGATAFTGNIGLCGSWVSLPPCSVNEHKIHSLLERVGMPIVAATGIVVLLLGILQRSRNLKKPTVKVGTQVLLMES